MNFSATYLEQKDKSLEFVEVVGGGNLNRIFRWDLNELRGK
jgi:hypothetical protein